MRRQIVATVSGGLSLFVIQALTGVVLGPIDVEMPPGFTGWVLLSNVLVAGVLAWFARRATWTGWRLAAALFAIGFGFITGWLLGGSRQPERRQAMSAAA